MAEEMTEKPTEGTTPGGKYLTKDYLVRNLQKFWNKIKEYITDQIKDLTNKTYVSGAIDNAISGKADKTALETLTTEVNTKADESRVEELADFLEDKVDKDGDKVLSTNDFTDEDKTKLDSLTNEVATNSTRGLMSASDKAKLDNIAEEATRVIVDTEWDPNSTNPAQSKVISEFISAELAKKVDKEDLKDPSELIRLNSITSYATDEGHIVLNFIRDTEYLKIYTPNSDGPIEKVFLKDQNEVLFTNFQENDDETLTITIENPEGKDGDAWNINEYTSFNFYIESLIVENKKYKPFVLKALRNDENDLTKINLSIIKVFES